MVEKRTVIFVALAVIVWASITTSLTAYYYLEQAKYRGQLFEKQQSLDDLEENYSLLATKWNFLRKEYGKLYGNFQFSKYMGWFKGENCTSFMNTYSKMLANLKDNYTTRLNENPDLNKTYSVLWNKTQNVKDYSTITVEKYEEFIEKWYQLFVLLVMKDLNSSIGETLVLTVDLCIDYGNGTSIWHNGTSMPLGSNVFDLIKKVAENVNFTYYPDMAPGHVSIDSINHWTKGWWLWFYWDKEEGNWVMGPVGCDAWTLKNNGCYKWLCSMK